MSEAGESPTGSTSKATFAGGDGTSIDSYNIHISSVPLVYQPLRMLPTKRYTDSGMQLEYQPLRMLPTTTDRDSGMQSDVTWLSDGKIAFYRKEPLSKTTKTVFRGRQQFLPEHWREVAIKVVKCEDETILEELKLLQKLSHPNIVQLFDAGIHRGGLYELTYIVMELCSQTLTTYVEKYRFNFQKSFSFVSQIVEGLGYLHNNNVVHRDLKPDNVLFSKDKKTVKLADFGLSKEIPVGLTSATVTLAGVGTEGYRAPETYQEGNRYCSYKTDIFPFGLVTHFIFTNGKHPFGTNPHEWSYNIMKNQNRDLDQIPKFKESYANKRAQLIKLLEKTLEYDPDDRPTTKDIKQSAFFTDHYGGSASDSTSQIRTSPHERHKKASSSASDSVTQASPGATDLSPFPLPSLANLSLADNVARAGGTVNINYHDSSRIVAETVNKGQMTATYQDRTASITANQTSPQGEKS